MLRLRHLLCGAALLMAAGLPGMVRAEAATMPAASGTPALQPAASQPAVVHLEDADIVLPPEGTQLPLDMAFVDEAGKSVKLGDYFKPGRPVLLALMYYRCPGLCSTLLNELTTSVQQMQLKAGAQFEVVLISIDPLEKPGLAQAKKDIYMEQLGNAAAPTGWHLLVSPDNQVRELADKIGFGYKLNPVNNQYMHSTAVYIAMPSGKISRVMDHALTFDPAVLDDSLTNASGGKIGSTLFNLAQTCGFLTYNPATGKYEKVARNIMRAGAALTVLALGLTIGTFLYRDGRKRHPRVPPAV